ncbi:MAG: hypothetical protein M1337_01345, partial [Actinobacteria bacterium]|nr:hypothetical protein [Actinomycetota bacterium]
MDSLMNPHGGGRRVRGRALTVGTATVGLVALMLVGTAGTVLGHAVTAVSGTVDCAGNYTISVTGDVYDPVHLFITVGGTTIDEGLQGSNQSTRTFGPYTGTGAYAGEPADELGISISYTYHLTTPLAGAIRLIGGSQA